MREGELEGTEEDDHGMMSGMTQQFMMPPPIVNPTVNAPTLVNFGQDLLDLDALFEGDGVFVAETTAPNARMCSSCGECLIQRDEPEGVFSFPLRWRWDCPKCKRFEITGDDDA